MMALGLVGGIMSGVMGMMAANAQANATAEAANKNAQIAEYNRLVAERNKATVLAEADASARDVSRDNRRTMGTIRAMYGASGLSMEGSPLNVMEDSALEGELDVAKTRYKGQLKAIGYADEAQNYRLKAELHRMEAASAQRAGGISAAGALFGGLASAGKSFSMG